ncbi:MAG TPA: nitroreductase family protein [Syntrophorhabdaceae bacterium]|nr:Coenzyme F420:L-glutamate ligase [Syntrophorhabdaceae bacterium]OQC47271.1 MAG: NADH dehydrogenase [Deltaproteobacteria bacterium ADurb.Bin026]HNZ58801.1 nitroreductase family protein [Syntrophorhabdaceae bacterium]HOB68938.1 nitroreductase family protein [Syntrophorhabdaceae bacterium]HQG49941.1 nitroreductase family protein [Syntrophorhabdaceae bacterium]
MELIKAIYERRSVRRFKKDNVPDEIITEILDAARWAPSWANTQVCSYIVVKDQTIKERLVDTLPPTNPARNGIIDAPVLICLIAKRGVSGYYKGTASTNKGDWFMFDAGIAMEHIVLAAWNFGLGTVHVGMFDADKAQIVLNIPSEFNIVEMTPLGYFDDVPKATPRKQLKELTFLDEFGKPYITQ